MQLKQQLHIKPIYRITGTPENFLTAIRFKIWGFNEGNSKQWKQLEPGDIIFFHCKKQGSFFTFDQKSVVIGFGVVGDSFFQDTTPLWIDEIEQNYSYPYRFHFAEMYLFSEVPMNNDWDSQSYKKKTTTEQILQNVVNSGIPLSDLEGFPRMGSYSIINNSTVKSQLLSSKNSLVFYDGQRENEEDIQRKKTALKVVSISNEITRSSTTLTIFDDIRQKILKEASTTKRNNIEALNKAEKDHYEVLKYLLTHLNNKGYTVLNNNHIDLFAYKNGGQSLLVEAKSIHNRNFISQSRKGIIQLFEYNYFDVQEFKTKNDLSFSNEVKILATSKRPGAIQNDYINFINSTGIKTMAVENNRIIKYGDSVNFAKL